MELNAASPHIIEIEGKIGDSLGFKQFSKKKNAKVA